MTLAPAALASALAGNAGQGVQLSRTAVSRLGDADSLAVQAEVRLTALVLAKDGEAEADLESMDELGAVDRRLLKGIADIRMGNNLAALDQLVPIAQHHPEAVKGVLAGYFTAIAAHRERDFVAAERWLDEANERLERLLAGGDLGADWPQVARPLVARREAELLIKGRMVSPPVDYQFIEDAHNRWQPVDALLKQASQCARNQEWGKARDLYLAAIGTEPFTWEAAKLLYPRLTLKMALAFALAGDTGAYATLCMRFEGLDAGLDEHFVEVNLLPGAANAFGKMKLLIDSQRLADERESEGIRHAPEWRMVLAALASIREGDLTTAERSLVQAQTAYSLACAGVALAYDARLKAQQGDNEPAEGRYAQAQSNFDRLNQSHGEDWGKYWFEIAWLQLLLESR